MGWIRDLFTSAYKLQPEERQRAVRWVCGVAATVLVLTLFLMGKAAATPANAEHPLWEVVIKARLALFDGLLSLGKWIAVCALTVGTWFAFQNSEAGKRLFTWAEGESETVKAAKKLNAGIFLAALFLACSWVMR